MGGACVRAFVRRHYGGGDGGGWDRVAGEGRGLIATPTYMF